MKTLSVTDSCLTMFSSWYTQAMPASRDWTGLWKVTF